VTGNPRKVYRGQAGQLYGYLPASHRRSVELQLLRRFPRRRSVKKGGKEGNEKQEELEKDA